MLSEGKDDLGQNQLKENQSNLPEQPPLNNGHLFTIASLIHQRLV
jgi:hypothetical protein